MERQSRRVAGRIPPGTVRAPLPGTMFLALHARICAGEGGCQVTGIPTVEAAEDDLMELPRFFVGLGLLVLALVVFRFATDPLAGTNMTSTLAQAAGGVVGGLIWGLAIWTPIRLIRGSKKAPEVRRFALYTTAVVVVAFIVFRFF